MLAATEDALLVLRQTADRFEIPNMLDKKLLQLYPTWRNILYSELTPQEIEANKALIDEKSQWLAEHSLIHSHNEAITDEVGKGKTLTDAVHDSFYIVDCKSIQTIYEEFLEYKKMRMEYEKMRTVRHQLYELENELAGPRDELDPTQFEEYYQD